jgi:hypothetical protein
MNDKIVVSIKLPHKNAGYAELVGIILNRV